MERVHLARAYLDPARDRPNLTIRAETLIDRLMWSGGRVSGVRAIRDGQAETLSADLVVLTAGAIGTPAILQRSGIGPAELLRPILGYAPLLDLPGVGANFWDQPGTSVAFDAAPGARERVTAPFGSLVAKVKSDPADEWFDLHVFMSHTPGPPGSRFFGAQIWMLAPRECGTVRIVSADPEAAPHIEGRAGHPDDLEAMARAIELVREIVANPAMRKWVGVELRPGSEVVGASLRQWCFDHLDIYHHACGTAKVGPEEDPLAAAGPNGAVRGLENLFIADASLIPVIPRAAVHLPVLAIAEKVAARLRADPSPRSVEAELRNPSP
jgi:choline dehydrogenase